MKPMFLALAFVGILATTVSAQTPVDATVCEVVSTPQSFDGKWVRIKGTVRAGLDEFVIRDKSCPGKDRAIWLSYPEGTKGLAGPVAFLQVSIAKNNPASVTASKRVSVQLRRDSDFQRFDTLLSTPVRVPSLCPGCVGYAVDATLVGRLDGTAAPGVVRQGKRITTVSGFGNLHQFSARLVLESVAGISPVVLNYSDAGDRSAVPPSDSGTDGKTLSDRWKAAGAAWGAPGEDNGVVVSFGSTSDLDPHDGEKSGRKSPDGAVYTARFAADRVKDRVLGVAMAHMGAHIAELRQGNAQATDSAASEFRAWEVSVFDTLMLGPDVLQAPGGRVIWNKPWSGPDGGRIAAGRIITLLDE